MTTDEYIDELVFQLRMLDVPGKRIGAIRAETANHLTESGEDPESAFGDPQTYARELAAADGRRLPREVRSENLLVQLIRSMGPKEWLIAIGSFVAAGPAAYLLITGLLALLFPEDFTAIWGTWPTLAVGAVFAAAYWWWLRRLEDPIRDPDIESEESR